MIITITGSRTISDKGFIFNCMDNFLAEIKVHPDAILLRSGNARGVDRTVEEWCREKNITVVQYKPDWSIGRHAGILRNELMIGGSDYLVGIWDGKSRGTQHALNYASKLRIPSRVYLLSNKEVIQNEDKRMHCGSCKRDNYTDNVKARPFLAGRGLSRNRGE